MKTQAHPQFVDQPYWATIDENSAHARLADAIGRGRRDWHRGVARGNPGQALLGEMLAHTIHPEGGLDYFPFPAQRRGDKPIIKEMIDTAQGQMALLEKVRIDVAFGMADIPLLYGPIYQRIAPPNGFPGGVYQIDEYTLQANVVFLQKFEGGEVQFGTLEKAAPNVGLIQTYAAGFEWTEDMIEFDRTYSIELNNQAFGRSFNALLNHLHLSPIIGYSYTSPNQTAANTTGATTQEKTHLTFQTAYQKTVNATVRRTGSVLLASEANRFQIEEALLTPVRDAQGNPLANVPINTIVYYNGESITRGSDVYAYPGVTTGKCYLIFPQRRLKELVHHDLRIDVGPPDLSRLVEGQQVARARRGLFADIANSVEEITLP